MNLYDATEQAYKNGVEAGKPKWIPVTKKLPAAVSKHKRFRTEYTKSNRVLCVCVQKSGRKGTVSSTKILMFGGFQGPLTP